MSLTFGLESAKDLREKLIRDAKLLDQEVTSDTFFNFVVTGYSLIDWVKKDAGIPAHAKSDSEINALYADKWLKICGDLATAAKHFTLTSRIPITSSAISTQGWGAGRYGAGPYGVGEESIQVELNTGEAFNAIDLAQGVVASWKVFFDKHSI